MRSRILFLSGRPDDAREVSRMLQSLPVIIDHAGNLHQARAKLQECDYDIVLTEASLPDGNWLDVLHLARASPQELEVIITDQHADAHLWSEALNRGAYDLIAQPFHEPEVRRILHNACSHHARERAPMAAL